MDFHDFLRMLVLCMKIIHMNYTICIALLHANNDSTYRDYTFEWKQRRKWNLMKSNGMNFCCAMERSEWNAAPSSPQLRGKPSQSTNQSLFMKANWWLLARSLLLLFFFHISSFPSYSLLWLLFSSLTEFGVIVSLVFFIPIFL